MRWKSRQNTCTIYLLQDLEKRIISKIINYLCYIFESHPKYIKLKHRLDADIQSMVQPNKYKWS